MRSHGDFAVSCFSAFCGSRRRATRHRRAVCRSRARARGRCLGQRRPGALRIAEAGLCGGVPPSARDRRDPVRADAVDRRHHDAVDRAGAAGDRGAVDARFPTRPRRMRSPTRSRRRRARCSAAARRSRARSTPSMALLFDNPYQRDAARDRHLRRRLEQSRALGQPGARRGGAGGRRHQRAADPRARAGSRQLFQGRT